MGNETIVHSPTLQDTVQFARYSTVCKMIVCKMIVFKGEDRHSLQEHGMQFVNLDDMRINTICKSRKYILVKLHKKRKRV